MDFCVDIYLCRGGKDESSALLLRSAAIYTGQNTDGWQVMRMEKGKPYFPDRPEVQFSVSHSGEYWGCAFSQAPLGFDLQQIVPCRAQKLSVRFFHREEDRFLASCAYDPEQFFRIWTEKESYVKCLGDGLYMGLDTFNVTAPLPDGRIFHHPDLLPGYSACLCLPGPAEVRIHDF